MDLRFTPEERAFREEMREFFHTQIPRRIREASQRGEHVSKEDEVTAQRIMNAAGLAVPHWPKPWGGRDWSPVQLYLWQDEMQQSGTPAPLAFNCNMVGPVIAQFGSEAQKERFLPRAANLDDWWCQGFSEPGAGSDLASLRTTAVRDGDEWLVNGQKTWTTLAQFADWIFCLCRTDPSAKKQEGISFLLIDMKTPGITVRPIQLLDGGHEVNEVWFDDVRVPGGEPGRAGEQGLGLRQVPARQRAHRDRAHRHQQGAAAPGQGAGGAGAGGRPSHDRGRALPREDRLGRGGAEGAGDYPAPHRRRRAGPAEG